MGSKTELPRSSFWNSAETRKFIGDAAEGKSELPADVEPWQSMFNVMVENNNKDRFPRCSFCLFMFVDLFHVYGASLKTRWGPEWSETPAKELHDDKLSLAFLKFFKEIIAIDRVRAQIALRKIASKGLPYKMPGGHAGKYRSKDFGIEFLIGLSAKIEKILTRQRKQENLEAKVTDIDARRRMPLVILDWSGKDKISLQYQEKKVQLTPKQAKLVFTLFSGRGAAIPYQVLWDALYPDDPYESNDTGPPGALKTHKKDINKILREAFEPPPNHGEWIDMQKLEGYVLNSSVKWQFAKDAKDNTPVFFRSADLPSASDVFQFLNFRHVRAITVGSTRLWVWDKTKATLGTVKKLGIWSEANMLKEVRRLEKKFPYAWQDPYIKLGLKQLGLVWPKRLKDWEANWQEMLRHILKINVRIFPRPSGVNAP
jgi:hypothetical protein